MKQLLQTLEKDNLVKILTDIFTSYTTPAFGTLPKSEIDLVLLDAIIKSGYISSEPNGYELVSKLKITNTKAKKLIYERELRKYDLTQLDNKAKEVLSNPIIQKEGNLFLFEIDNPLLIDHVKNRLKILGHLSDGSFSSSIIKLSSNAMRELVVYYIKDDIKDVERKLALKGIEQSTIKGFISSLLSKVGRKFADDTGEEVAQNIKEYLAPIFVNINDEYLNKVKEFFDE
ncbi:hypothetical protein HOK00_02280 [bacterium]|nr:hypothetical protein [bacterium]